MIAGCSPRAPLAGSASSQLSEITGDSQWTTWTCTGSPCPWGSADANHAIAWPAAAEPVAARLGYTASPAPYVPARIIAGATISIDAGTADVYAGEPQAASHHWLATVSQGQSYEVTGLDDDEVLSVQSASAFSYRVTPPAAPPPDAGVPIDAPPDSPDTDAGPGPGDASAGDASHNVTWTCTGSPCPWGTSLSGHALVWPADAGAIATRLGYTVSAAVYLPASRANGASLSIETGEVGVYAGAPGAASHRWLATVAAGASFVIHGLADGEVASVQSDDAFTYQATLPPPGDPDPDPGDIIQAIPAVWRCNLPGCTDPDWTGAVINWPSSAAYQTNARAGNQSRSVLSAADGTPLYPYMQGWAQGCKVTAESGTVLIIEWQRGTDTWRETWLDPGQTHVIDLVAPEDGAMIETYEGSPGFSVSLEDCTPP